MHRALAQAFLAVAIFALVQVDCLDLGDAVDSKGVEQSDGGDAYGLLEGGWLENGTPCSCVLAAPPGWTGPLALFEGAPGSVPACGPAYPSQVVSGKAGLVAPPGTCAACSCSGANGSTCAPTMTITPYTGVTCTGIVCAGNVATVSSQVCAALTGVGGIAGCGTSFAVSAAPQVLGGSCTPSAPQVLKLDQPIWGKEAVGCGAVSVETASCGKGAVCMPEVPVGFESSLCISQLGNQICPAAYPSERTYYASFADDRGCSDCTCGAPTGYCDAMIAFYGGADCTSLLGPSTTIAQGSCHPTAGAVSVKTLVGQALGLSCSPAGGPTGSAVPGDPVTVCCQ